MTELNEREIEELVARHPLPEGVPDCVMNREEMAEALNTSMNTVTSWITAGMPVRQHGGQGKPYELVLSHCFAWRQARIRDEEVETAKRRDAIAAMRLALTGGASGDSIEALDPKSRREILAAQMAHEAFERERNRLMRREVVVDMLETIFSMTRDTMDAAPDRCERAAALDAKATNALVDVCDGLLEELRLRIVKFWDDHPERADITERRDLFDA